MLRIATPATASAAPSAARALIRSFKKIAASGSTKIGLVEVSVAAIPAYV
jgi:hypothetical protein